MKTKTQDGYEYIPRLGKEDSRRAGQKYYRTSTPCRKCNTKPIRETKTGNCMNCIKLGYLKPWSIPELIKPNSKQERLFNHALDIARRSL